MEPTGRILIRFFLLLDNRIHTLMRIDFGIDTHCPPLPPLPHPDHYFSSSWPFSLKLLPKNPHNLDATT